MADGFHIHRTARNGKDDGIHCRKQLHRPFGTHQWGEVEKNASRMAVHTVLLHSPQGFPHRSADNRIRGIGCPMFQTHQALPVQLFRLLLPQTGDCMDGMVAIHDGDIVSSVVLQNACGKYRKRSFADTTLWGSDGNINGVAHIFFEWVNTMS